MSGVLPHAYFVKVTDVALRSCEQRMFELKDSVCSARQKKIELAEDTMEADNAIAELEKELGLLLSAGSTSKTSGSVPVTKNKSSQKYSVVSTPTIHIEYENVSDCEHAPKPSTTEDVSSSSVTSVSHQAVSYEAISDSECSSWQDVSRLAPPSIQVEPISDTEESAVPIETEPVSDIEDEPTPSAKVGVKVGTGVADNTKFLPVDMESLTDAESDDALCHAHNRPLFLREHDYCKDGSNIEDLSIVGVALKPADECKPDRLMSSQQDVESPQESDHDVFIVGEVSAMDMEQTFPLAKQKTSEPKPVAQKRGVQKRLVTSQPQSSGGLESALQMAISKALPCSVSKAIKDLQPHVAKPAAPLSPHSSKDLSTACVQPLVNSVVSMLTKESLVDITTKVSPSTPSPPPVVNHVRLDAYFHSCDSNAFLCSEQQPPLYVLPCMQDLPLAVGASSISDAALQALHNSFSLAMEGKPSQDVIREKQSAILAAVASTTSSRFPASVADTAGELAPPDSTHGEGKVVTGKAVKTKQPVKPVKSQQLVKAVRTVKTQQPVKSQQPVKPVRQQNSVQKVVESRLQGNKLAIVSKHPTVKEEVNSQTVPPKPVIGDPTETCARTSGLHKSKAVPPQANTQITSTTSETVSVRILVKKILSAKDFSLVLDGIGSSHIKDPATTARQFSPLSFFASESMIPSSMPSQPSIPDKVLSEIESSPNLSTSNPLLPTDYHPYSSPLLMFNSYRLNPAFHSNNKIPLDSLTYSNKLDPNKVMCKFELTGVCSDPNCTAQHVKDLEMTEEEVVKDLVSYAPTLAGCTSEELTLAGGDEPQVATAVAKKISSYTSKLLKKYVDKVSSKELYRLTVHEANAERVKSKAKKEFVNFEERPWSTPVLQTSVVPSSKDLQPSVPSASLDLSDMGPDVGHPLICPPQRVDERR